MLSRYLKETADNIRAAANADLDGCMERAIGLVADAVRNRRPVLVCGNGGSMADSLHISGELVSRFKVERQGLPVIALGINLAASTAWSNDYSYETQFAREVEAFGTEGSTIIGLSTSGNSSNVIAAFETARQMGMKTIALTGKGGGKLADLADVLLAVPLSDTPRVQEAHVACYHYLCMEVEKAIV
ncbi:MAG: SIS domain-containing protein [Kiloniellales bacterium]|nr:SIS domain-containing protein [Kiloniellales bacterium]